jgi:hypothetical protein
MFAKRNVGESNKGSQINLLMHQKGCILCVPCRRRAQHQAYRKSERKKSAKVNLFYHRFTINLRPLVIHRRIKAQKSQNNSTNPIVRVYTRIRLYLRYSARRYWHLALLWLMVNVNVREFIRRLKCILRARAVNA